MAERGSKRQKALKLIQGAGHNEFTPASLGIKDYNLFREMMQKRLLEQPRGGYYKIPDEIRDIFKAYYERKSQGKKEPASSPAAAAKAKAQWNRRLMQQVVRVTPYAEDQVLIQVGRRLYLATEVALTARKGNRE